MNVNGKGALFNNSRKEPGSSHPDRQGNFTLTRELLDAFCHAFDHANGAEVKVQIAGWLKKDKNGNPYLSLSISPPYEKPQERQQAIQASRRENSSDIPF
jgi:hypothetical protein